jgi:hypothetical protein
MHCSKLAHSDLKLINVRMTHAGTALITDFGISYPMDNSLKFHSLPPSI